MTQITHNLTAIKQRIVTAARLYGRNPDSVHLLAVSKKHSVESVREASQAGQRHFGENFLAEAIGKISQLNEDLTWHFIGAIQSNKSRDIARYFDWVHSIDRTKIAQRLHRARGPGHPLNVLIQVNLSADTERAGVQPDDLNELAGQIAKLSRLRLRGLMAMAPNTDCFDSQSQAFARTHELFLGLQSAGFELDSLSMGMSGDLEAAIKNGATWVRIGTDLFGKREPG